MYFPTGWPKILNFLGNEENPDIKQVVCNRDRVLVAILTADSISIWFCKPCVPIVFYRREKSSLEKLGENVIVEWKPDSSMLVIATSEGHLLFYNLNIMQDQKGLYIQTDSPQASLRRDSAELFIKETIPPLQLSLAHEVMVWDGKITSMACITMMELMAATTNGHVLRYKWDGTQNRDYNLDLRRIPFCVNQQVSKAVPIVEENTYIINLEYSPLIGGFSIVLNDGRAAFLTASSLRFDPNQVQGIWAQGIEDATCCSVNHKYRLITFGRANAECIVYTVDESTGGLEASHNCILSSKDYPGCPGKVSEIKWTPDGCAMVASWSQGGIGMWSTFGALLMCSLGWDYGLNVDLQKCNPLHVTSLEWTTEGYQLWMVHKNYNLNKLDLIQMDFVKSALTINPCMSHQSHLYLQGDDRLYVNSADTLVKIFSSQSQSSNHVSKEEGGSVFGDNSPLSTCALAEGRQWLVIPIPSTYSSTNWPVRYSAIDQDGTNIVIAGRTGLAHYSMLTRRWKLFGNETQEKDFIVAGGMLWWNDYIVLGCYSIVENSDELRLYPKDSKLDNKYAKIIKVTAPILLINNLYEQLITFGTDGQVTIYSLKKQIDNAGNVDVMKMQSVDISALCVHPTCIVSITLTTLRTESGRGGQNVHFHSESMILNISGRLLMVQRETAGNKYVCSMPTVLASCVENVWVPFRRRPDKVHLTESLWLFCGAHGMRVWLPLYPRDGDKSHSFMSKRIMLPFHLRIYPLAILFEDAIILGAENDTVLYTSDTSSPFSLPFSVLQRTSQVYLHQILRQLIRRNLGYHAWEIARSCMSLPYFPHSLELLLHEVLEEEATSKEPIPDAQLPSVIEFILEFPMYLQTVVQCARKTEIALWPYLFSAAGKPKDLFQECMAKRQLDTAASYLIILQNLETSSVSRQYATLLLDTALELSKWELAKDLVRFLRAIDPNDVESPRNSFILPQKLGISLPQTPPVVSPNAEDISLILGNVQGSRVRSYSTTITPKIPDTTQRNASVTLMESPLVKRKKSVPSSANNNSKEDNENKDASTGGSTAEEFFIDVILQRHARRLLSSHRLTDLGYFAAHLDFHLVAWLGKERDRVARIDDFVTALKQLHEEFNWPYPPAINLTPKTSTSARPSFDISGGGIDERFKEMSLENSAMLMQATTSSTSHVGDSGYVSIQGLPCTTLTQHNINDLSSQIAETEVGEEPQLSELTQTSDENNEELEDFNLPLKTKKIIKLFEPNTIKSNKSNFQLLETQLRANDENVHENNQNQNNSTMSCVSSVWGGDDNLNVNDWEVPSPQILEQLSNAGNKGSHRSEVQLRYLLQLFMEASCLEWSLLISVLLRDALAVLRTVNAAKSSDQSIESVTRLKQGLQILHYWTHTECLGYKAFMLAVQNQISVLSKILTTKIQQQQIMEHQQALTATLSRVAVPNPPRSRKSSSNNQQETNSQNQEELQLQQQQQQQQIAEETQLSNSNKIKESINKIAAGGNENLSDNSGCTIS